MNEQTEIQTHTALALPEKTSLEAMGAMGIADAIMGGAIPHVKVTL